MLIKAILSPLGSDAFPLSSIFFFIPFCSLNLLIYEEK